MKNLFTLFLLVSTLTISFQSCKFFSLAEVPNGKRSIAKVPPLEPKFDLKSFGVTYKDLYDIPGAIISGGVNPEGIVSNVTQSLTSAEDTKRIYQTFILRNICESVGETQGTAVCRMGVRSRGIEKWVNPLVSVLTLGIANIFGYTYANYEDNLEVFVDIKNNQDDVVASYTGIGQGFAKAKAYKGYNVKSARRMAHARAFTAAMEDIQDQMERDNGKLADILAE